MDAGNFVAAPKPFFQSIDFSFIANVVSKPPKPAPKPVAKTIECRGCLRDFADIQHLMKFKIKYGPCCEPDAKQKEALIKALQPPPPKPAHTGTNEFRNCRTPGCGTRFELPFKDAPYTHCPSCFADYNKRKNAAKPSPTFTNERKSAWMKPGLVFDSDTPPRSVVHAERQAKFAAERALKETLREAHAKNELPQGVTVIVNGTQLVFKLTDGRSITTYNR